MNTIGWQGRRFPGKMVLAAMLFLNVACIQVFAQQPNIDARQREAIITRIESIAERNETELDYSELLDGLYYLMDHPLNLNYASFDELKQLIFLSEHQISRIIEYRSRYGNFMTIFELQSVEGFDAELVGLITPFVIISQEKPVIGFGATDVFKYGKHDLFLRYGRVPEKQKGYESLSDSARALNPNSYYLGSPDKIYTRYSFNYANRIRAGITAEKDAGEEFFKGSQPRGFDFYSAFISVKDIGVIKDLIVGDYHANFGQGLTLWTGLAFGRSIDDISINRNSSGIRPNVSANENLFLRGTAITVGLSDFRLTGFYSSKKIDANQSDPDSLTSEEIFITSIQESGYHRTNGEIADKDATGEKLYGGRFEFRKKIFSIGTTAYQTHLGTPLVTDGQLYKKYNFTGDKNSNFGFDFNVLLSPFLFFGELSASENGGKAYLAGIQASISPRVAFSLFYRNYGIDYQNLYSNALGESSTNQNEKGLYAGVLLRLHKNWSFNGYADQFSFPWLRYRTDAPSKGCEYLGQLNYTPAKNVLVYFRYRYDQKSINSDSETLIPKLSLTERNNYRLHLDYSALPWLYFKNRIELVTFNKETISQTRGFMIYQDVLIRPEQQPFDLSLRYAIFDTDSYDDRIYTYENDVLYAFSIPSYYYKGSRFYAMVRYDLNDFLDIWLRYARTFYTNQKTISSGLDEINGAAKSEIKFQIRMKF